MNGVVFFKRKAQHTNSSNIEGELYLQVKIKREIFIDKAAA